MVFLWYLLNMAPKKALNPGRIAAALDTGPRPGRVVHFFGWASQQLLTWSVYIHVYTTYTHIYIHTYIYIYTQIDIYIYICTHYCVYVYIYMLLLVLLLLLLLSHIIVHIYVGKRGRSCLSDGSGRWSSFCGPSLWTLQPDMMGPWDLKQHNLGVYTVWTCLNHQIYA